MRDSGPGLVHAAVPTGSQCEAEVSVLEVAETVDGIEAADLVEALALDEKAGACEEVDEPREPIFLALGTVAVPVARGRA
jgi:hypothetical protein